MPDELFGALNLPDPTPPPGPRAGRAKPGDTYKVLAPGERQAARGRAQEGMTAGPRVEPGAGKYNMKPGPAPSRPAAPAPAALAPPPDLPKYDPATYDPVEAYAALRSRLGLPGEVAAPLEVYAPPPELAASGGMAETFMAPMQEAALAATTLNPPRPSGPLTRGMGRLGQAAYEGKLMPQVGGLKGMAGVAALGLGAGAVNDPEAALQVARHPLESAYNLGSAGVNAVVNPQQSWVPDFTQGMTRLMSGDVGAGELAGAVGDATLVRPMFNAGVRMGGTLHNLIGHPITTGQQIGRGLSRIAGY